VAGDAERGLQILLTSYFFFAVLKVLSTVKEFTETAVPPLSRAQLMTPDKRMNPCRGVMPRQRIRKIR
jgi:hypothetical protein